MFLLYLGKGLIACGDDKGQLWLYNQPQFGKDAPMGEYGGDGTTKRKPGVTLKPTELLTWPELQDDYLKNYRKV